MGKKEGKKAPRKKVPKELAVIHADNCTGCESCLEVCPVDAIELKKIDGIAIKGNGQWCEIDLERCVGCEVCVHIPQKHFEFSMRTPFHRCSCGGRHVTIHVQCW